MKLGVYCFLLLFVRVLVDILDIEIVLFVELQKHLNRLVFLRCSLQMINIFKKDMIYS